MLRLPHRAWLYSRGTVNRRMLLMKRRPKIFYTEAGKALMWDRWQKGDSMNEIARGLGRYHSSVQRILTLSGGVRPAPRKRSRLALTLAEREEVSRGLVARHSLRTIAEQLRPRFD